MPVRASKGLLQYRVPGHNRTQFDLESADSFGSVERQAIISLTLSGSGVCKDQHCDSELAK